MIMTKNRISAFSYKMVVKALLMLCIFTSCAHLMETSPSTDVDKSVILEDDKSIEVAMNGVYSTMYNRLNFVTANAHQCFGNMAVTLAADLMGEDMVQTAEGAGWFWKDYSYETRERYTSKIQRCYFTWKYFYEIINNVNYILSVENTATGDKANIQYLMSQAYAVRAFAYFMLIQSYQQTYIGHESAPGVPIYTEPTLSSSKGKGRGTVQDVYDQILSDISRALVGFQSCGMVQKYITEMDYYATNMLLARVSLVMNDWETAISAAREVMKKPGCTLLTIEDATIEKGLFNPSDKSWVTGKTPFNSINSSSVIWGAKVLTEQSTVYASFFSQMDACTNLYYAAEAPKCISNWLYAQIPDTDIRKSWWNGDIGIPVDKWHYGANINYNQHKFQWADQKSYTGDYIFMRLEEAYLIEAEAQCRLANYDAAKKALLEIGTRRDYAYQSKIRNLSGNEQTFASCGKVQTLMDEILLQRRIELWGETGRIFDILRLKKGWTRTWEINGNPSNHTNTLSKYPEYANFPPDYIECILMIPQTELDNNPNITTEDQNPYIQY